MLTPCLPGRESHQLWAVFLHPWQVHAQLVEAEGSYAKWGFDDATTPSGEALYTHLFASEAIEWNRIGHFRNAQMDRTPA